SPHRRHYWYGYRPWYSRWYYYSPWWAGRWYRPWYYSPVYVGGGITMAIVLGLILMPLFGIALWFPFSSADVNGNVTYRSTETLYFNEYWYEYEDIRADNDMTFSVQSSPSVITFAIWDQPFENLPTTSIIDNESDQLSLIENRYEYFWLFLKPGSSIQYNYNSSGQIDFFIADGYELYDWDQGGSPSFDVLENDVLQGNGNYLVNEGKDYYLVWYNEGVTTVNVNFSVSYTAVGVHDFSVTDYYVEGVTSVSQDTYTVPNSGNWYFFVFFDPMNAPEETTTITFDVSYDTGVDATDRWISIQPWLIGIMVVVGIIIIIAVFARRGQKKLKTKEPKKATPEKAVKKATKKTELECIRCGNTIRADAKFCSKCGGKIEGRSLGSTNIITPINSKTCSYCGSKLTQTDKFCKWCGTKIET
ncbi:MAG: zinc ribbon domain-containing protein, partial [Asgard group archaeon]|nr:zinc ribbon domain-containing protein [Asgard group archaeon]